MSQKSPSSIVQIVTEDQPKLLIEQAKTLAKQLRSDEASKTQLRRLYGTMQQIEMNWREDEADAYRELLLFKPRLWYQCERHSQLEPLVIVLDAGIDAVGDDLRKLKRLSQFFEATLAYYVAQPKLTR